MLKTRKTKISSTGVRKIIVFLFYLFVFLTPLADKCSSLKRKVQAHFFFKMVCVGEDDPPGLTRTHGCTYDTHRSNEALNIFRLITAVFIL